MREFTLAFLLSVSSFLLTTPFVAGAAPSITLSPTLINFGNQLINTQSDPPRTVTVSNTGNSLLTVTEVNLAGANPTHYALNGLPSFPATVNPGGNFAFQVTFRPTTVGTKIATVAIKSDDPGRPTASVSLTGTGVAPDISVTPTLIQFANQCLNSESAPRTVTISNVAAGVLNVTAVTFAGAAPGDFKLNGPPSLPRAVPAGTNFSIEVVFRPTLRGTKSATLLIASDDPDEPTTTVILSGRAVAQEIELPTGPIDFGSQAILKPATSSSSIEIRNTDATCPLSITAITVTGIHLDDFVLSEVPMLPATAAPGTKIAFKVAFEPKAVGSRMANLTVTSNDPDEAEVRILLNGKGVAPDIDVTPTTKDFPDQCLNAQAPPQAITINNTGTVALTVTSVVNSDENNFLVSGMPTLPRVVNPGTGFTFNISFRPVTAGPLLARLTISSDDPDEPITTVTVVGKGIGPEIRVAPSVIDFGDQLINSMSSNSDVVVRNAHPTCKLTVSRVALEGATSGEFTLTPVSSLPKTLNPEETFLFGASFRPTSIGVKATRITIANDDPSAGASYVALGGRGVTKLEPTLGVLNWLGQPGQTTTIPISLSGTSGVSALQFTLSFNPAMLMLSGESLATRGPLLPEDFTISTNSRAPGQITVVISPPVMQPVATLKRGNGPVVDLSIQVAADALSGATSLLLLSGIAASDADGNAINISAQNGSIFVANPTRLIGSADHQGAAGAVMTIPVVLSDGFNLNKLQFTMNFDPTLLQLATTDGVTLGSLVPSGFSMNVTRQVAGQVTVSISGLPAFPPPVLNLGNGVVAQMKFEVNRTATSSVKSALTLSNIIASDLQGNAATIGPQLGTFTVAALRRGDVNQDGVVNAQDVVRLIQHLSGGKPLTGAGLQEADVNQDGQVNSLDLSQLTQMLAG
jgi:hypothetical protein